MTQPASKRTQIEINDAVLSTDHLLEGIGGRTARGGVIAIASQIIRFVLQLGTTFILARLLVPDQFGVVAIGGTVVAFITMFTELGISAATVQVKRLDQNTASAFLLINIAITLIAVLVAVLAGPLIGWIFKDERVSPVVIGLALSAPIGALGSIHFAILMRRMQWVSMQALGLGSTVAGAVAGVIAAWLFDFGYWALVVQSLTSAAISSFFSWVVCPWRPSWVRDWTGAKAAMKFGLNLNASMILNFFHRQLDNGLIGWRWGTTELGFYSRAYNLLLAPLNLVTGPLATAILPALSRLHGDDDMPKWRTAYLDALIVVTVIGGGMTALLFGAAEPIIDIVFGPGWEKSATIFSFLVVAMLGATAMNTTGWIYVSTGRTDRMLRWGLIGVPMYVVSFLIGLPFGAVGVAAAYGVSQILAFLPCFWMATRFTNITMRDILDACMPNILATVLVGIGLRFATEHAGLLLDLVAIAIAGIAYVALCALIVWRWPPYRRVRDRTARTVTTILDRLGLGAQKSGSLV